MNEEGGKPKPLLKDWRVSVLIAISAAIGVLIGVAFYSKLWHLPPAWGDIPTWITAIATVGLLVGAYFTAIYAIRAFRAQAQEISDQAAMLKVQSDQLAEQRRVNEKQIEVLELQAAELHESTEERNREAERRHQAQASRVFTDVEDHRPRYSHPYAKNGSDFPVYDAQFWQADPGGLSDPGEVGMIPPGGRGIDGRDISYLDAVDNTVLTFRDAAGARWIRMPDGTIKEQEHDTARDSILAALGRPLPDPAEPAAAAEPTGQAEEPEVPGAQ